MRTLDRRTEAPLEWLACQPNPKPNPVAPLEFVACEPRYSSTRRPSHCSHPRTVFVPTVALHLEVPPSRRRHQAQFATLRETPFRPSAVSFVQDENLPQPPVVLAYEKSSSTWVEPSTPTREIWSMVTKNGSTCTEGKGVIPGVGCLPPGWIRVTGLGLGVGCGMNFHLVGGASEGHSAHFHIPEGIPIPGLLQAYRTYSR